MSITAERLRQALARKGMKQAELSAITGIGKSSISTYLTGEYEPKQKNIYKMAKALDVSELWLMGLSDDIELQQNKVSIFDIPGVQPLPKTYNVPLLGQIACGDPILAEQNIADIVSVPFSIKGADFALTCKGDSMINARIFDGDIVYIHMQETVENGEIAAVLIDDEATLKKVYQVPGRITLRPCNPMYPDYEFSGEDLNKIRILGKAIAFTSMVRV